MLRLFAIIFLVILSYIANAQLPAGSGKIYSPDGRSILTLSVSKDSTMFFSVARDGKTYIDTARISLYFEGDNHNAVNPAKISDTKYYKVRDTLRSPLWERAVQKNHYNELVMKFKSGKRLVSLRIRAYDQGFATGFDIADAEQKKVDDYHTTYHWTNSGIFHLFDSKTEDGYSSILGKDRSTAIAPLLTLSTVDTLVALTAEGANYEFFTRAKLRLDNFSVTIGQNGLYKIGNYNTPWHCVIFADNANDFIEGKYIIRSVTRAASGDYKWVKPGKVYRHIGNKDADFATENVKRSIDFASRMRFQYLLLDNGWYGTGYENEFDPNSNPTTTVSTLDLPEAIRYAKLKGVGILLYFNKTAFSNFSSDSVLTVYSKMGVRGVKLGFFKNRSQLDNVLASRIITKCASLGMVVNVHDEYRSTGIERLYPNLLTSEGLRGNEYLDNTGNHTTVLPFVRYMVGPADYTICYEPADTSRLGLKTTKAHQLALSVILFSPLQHIFWYGSPEWYSNELEAELFKTIPTVWDDYKLIDGFPRRYMSLARRKGDTWYVASITGLAKKSFSFPLSTLTKRRCSVTVYEDGDAPNSIKKTSFVAAPTDTLSTSLRLNSGSVMVIKPVK